MFSKNSIVNTLKLLSIITLTCTNVACNIKNISTVSEVSIVSEVPNTDNVSELGDESPSKIVRFGPDPYDDRSSMSSIGCCRGIMKRNNKSRNAVVDPEADPTDMEPTPST